MPKIDRRSFIRSLLAIGLTTPGLRHVRGLALDEHQAFAAFRTAPLTIEHHGNLCIASRHLPEGHGTRWHAYNISGRDLDHKTAIEDLAEKVTVVRKFIARYSEDLIDDLEIENLELYDAGYDVNSVEALHTFMNILDASQLNALGAALAEYMSDPPNEESYGQWEIDEYGGEMIDEADEWTWARALFVDGPLADFVEELEIDLNGIGTFPGQAVSMGCTVEHANSIAQKYDLPIVFVE